MDSFIEYWLAGPVSAVPAPLQPVAHALLQMHRETIEVMDGFPTSGLWQRHYEIASPGFHLLHITGVLDRLFSYARGQQLNAEQLAYLEAESIPSTEDLARLLQRLSLQVSLALDQLKATDPKTLEETRFVGRKKIPSTQAGLLFHAAEHCMRHLGQLMVTVKIFCANQPSV